MTFLVSILHFKKISKSQRKILKDNMCRYLRRMNLWCFEGDWETTFDNLTGITHVGEFYWEHDLRDRDVASEVAAQLRLDPKQSWVPKI